MPVVTALTFQGRHRLSFPAARRAGKGIQPFGVLRRPGFWIPFPRPSASPGMTGVPFPERRLPRENGLAKRSHFADVSRIKELIENAGGNGTDLSGKAPPVIPGGAKSREGNSAFRRAASARFLDPLPSAFGLAGDDTRALPRKAIASRKRSGETKPFCSCEQNQGVD